MSSSSSSSSAPVTTELREDAPGEILTVEDLERRLRGGEEFSLHQCRTEELKACHLRFAVSQGDLRIMDLYFRYAMIFGHPHLLSFLPRTFDVERRLSENPRVLLGVISENHVSMMKYLLSSGIISRMGCGGRLLVASCIRRNFGMACLLLNNGVLPPLDRNDQVASALEVIVRNGSLDIFNTFVRGGAYLRSDLWFHAASKRRHDMMRRLFEERVTLPEDVVSRFLEQPESEYCLMDGRHKELVPTILLLQSFGAVLGEKASHILKIHNA